MAPTGVDPVTLRFRVRDNHGFLRDGSGFSLPGTEPNKLPTTVTNAHKMCGIDAESGAVTPPSHLILWLPVRALVRSVFLRKLWIFGGSFSVPHMVSMCGLDFRALEGE